jgi:tight adherence protein B
MEILGNDFFAMTVLVFVAVVLLLESLYYFWLSQRGPEVRKLRSRLRAASGAEEAKPEARLLKERMAWGDGPLERLAQALPGAHGLETMLLQSGLHWSPGKLFLLAAVAGLAGFAAVSAVYPVWFVVLAGVAVGAACPFAYLARSRTRRMRKLEQQLPEALDLIGRGLRAGHALSSTLKMAGEELPEPISGEFRAVHDEINFGISIQQALTNLATRVPSTDVRFFVVAVLIQRESGGNLTEILHNLSHLVRSRLKLLLRVRVLSSEGRLSAWILVVMPFALGGFMSWANYEFMSRLWTDPIGITLMKIMLSLMLVGILVIRKIVRIRV